MEMAWQREECKAGGDRSSGHSVWGLVETGYPIQFEDFIKLRTSGWLLCFSDLSAFTLILGSGFLLLRPIRIHTTEVKEDQSKSVSSGQDRIITLINLQQKELPE